jgi:hypothetical protein
VTTLLSALFLAAALRGSLELGDRTEARLTGTTGPTSLSAEVMTNPSAVLRLDTRRWEISARYAPSLTFRGLGLDPTLDLLHRGHLEASIEATRRLRVRFLGDGSYGSVRFLSPALAEADLQSAQPIDALPGAETIRFASLRAGAGVLFAATRRLKLDASAEYGLSGGVDAASQETYPQISGPRAEVGADVAITRRDSARSAAGATWVTFTSGEEAVVALITETWRHRFTRRTTSTLGIGAALDSVRAPGGAGRSIALYPVAEAAIAHRLPPKRLELGLGLRVAPVIDRLRGDVEPRLLLDASTAWKPNRRLSAWGRAGAAQSIPWGERDSLTLAFGEAGVGVRLADWVELINGARAAYQLRAETEPQRAQWMIFTGATFTAPRVRF